MIKIGMFGAGRFGQIHMNKLKELPAFEVSGFYDPDEKLAAEYERTSGVRRFRTEDELLEFSEAIDIVSPTSTHFALAMKALKKSKHVFIEKPVTNSTDEAKSLKAMAAEAGVKVQVGHVERFNPAFLTAHELVVNPIFIESHRLIEFDNAKKGVSVLNDLMVHDIDILMQLVKSAIKKISANSVGILNGSPDMVNARIEFDNGCVANLSASRLAVKKMRITRVYQKDASISINFLENKTGIIQNDPEKGVFLKIPQIEVSDAIKNELSRFAACIHENTEPAVTLDHAIQALTVADLIEEKLRPQQIFLK